MSITLDNKIRVIVFKIYSVKLSILSQKSLSWYYNYVMLIFMKSTTRNNINACSSSDFNAECLNIHYLKIFHDVFVQ